MKKVMFLMAVAGMFAFAACNNNAETTTDTTPAEPAIEEPTVEENTECNADTTTVEAGAEADAPVAE